MADYCYQCTEKHLGVDGKENDLQDLSTPEDTAQGLFPVVLAKKRRAKRIAIRKFLKAIR